MPRRRNAIPSYLLHAKSGEARTSYYDATGKRHVVSLGRHNSPESKTAYREILKQLEAPAPAPVKPTTRKIGKSPSLLSLCLAFLDHTKTYYEPDSTEAYYYRVVVGIIVDNESVAELKASDFGLAELSAVREVMIGKGWTRPTVNNHVRRIRTMFRWGTERGMVPSTKWGELQTLSGLKKGRTALPEHKKILPVSDADIERTLPHLTPTVARMVRFQRATGCRPQDACGLRWEEIDRTAPVWVFRPAKHKNAHRGHARAVLIGPAAQAVLGESRTGYVFSPATAQAEFRESLRKPRRPWQVAQKERNRALAPKRVPGERYGTAAYGTAITRACERAGVTPWTPNQLRHAALTEFRAKYGLEIARAIGGHKSAVTTERYAEPNAAAAMLAVGQSG